MIEKITILMNRQKKRQGHMADAIGVTQQQFSRYINGISEIPLHRLRKIAEELNVTTQYLIDGPDVELPIDTPQPETIKILTNPELQGKFAELLDILKEAYTRNPENARVLERGLIAMAKEFVKD